MPSRLAEAVVRRTGLPCQEVERGSFPLSLPVGEIELQLDRAYEAAVEAGRLQSSMVERLQEFRNQGRALDEPEVDAEIGAMVERLEQARARAAAFGGERILLQMEVQTRARLDTSRLNLWNLERLDASLFTLIYRERNLNDPSGVQPRDHALLFLDTTPGREGAEAFLHVTS